MIKIEKFTEKRVTNKRLYREEYFDMGKKQSSKNSWSMSWLTVD